MKIKNIAIQGLGLDVENVKIDFFFFTSLFSKKEAIQIQVDAIKTRLIEQKQKSKPLSKELIFANINELKKLKVPSLPWLPLSFKIAISKIHFADKPLPLVGSFPLFISLKKELKIHWKGDLFLLDFSWKAPFQIATKLSIKGHPLKKYLNLKGLQVDIPALEFNANYEKGKPSLSLALKDGAIKSSLLPISLSHDETHLRLQPNSNSVLLVSFLRLQQPLLKDLNTIDFKGTLSLSELKDNWKVLLGKEFTISGSGILDQNVTFNGNARLEKIPLSFAIEGGMLLKLPGEVKLENFSIANENMQFSANADIKGPEKIKIQGQLKRCQTVRIIQKLLQLFPGLTSFKIPFLGKVADILTNFKGNLTDVIMDFENKDGKYSANIALNKGELSFQKSGKKLTIIDELSVNLKYLNTCSFNITANILNTGKIIGNYSGNFKAGKSQLSLKKIPLLAAFTELPCHTLLNGELHFSHAGDLSYSCNINLTENRFFGFNLKRVDFSARGSQKNLDGFLALPLNIYLSFKSHLRDKKVDLFLLGYNNLKSFYFPKLNFGLAMRSKLDLKRKEGFLNIRDCGLGYNTLPLFWLKNTFAKKEKGKFSLRIQSLDEALFSLSLTRKDSHELQNGTINVNIIHLSHLLPAILKDLYLSPFAKNLKLIPYHLMVRATKFLRYLKNLDFPFALKSGKGTQLLDYQLAGNLGLHSAPDLNKYGISSLGVVTNLSAKNLNFEIKKWNKEKSPLNFTLQRDAKGVISSRWNTEKAISLNSENFPRIPGLESLQLKTLLSTKGYIFSKDSRHTIQGSFTLEEIYFAHNAIGPILNGGEISLEFVENKLILRKFRFPLFAAGYIQGDGTIAPFKNEIKLNFLTPKAIEIKHKYLNAISKLSLNISGVLNNPVIQGRAEIEKIHSEHPVLGSLIKDGNIGLEFFDHRLFLKKLQLAPLDGGKFTGSGSIALLDNNIQMGFLTPEPIKVDRKYFKGKSLLKFNCSGKLNRPTVIASLTLDGGKVEIKDAKKLLNELKTMGIIPEPNELEETTAVQAKPLQEIVLPLENSEFSFSIANGLHIAVGIPLSMFSGSATAKEGWFKTLLSSISHLDFTSVFEGAIKLLYKSNKLNMEGNISSEQMEIANKGKILGALRTAYQGAALLLKTVSSMKSSATGALNKAGTKTMEALLLDDFLIQEGKVSWNGNPLKPRLLLKAKGIYPDREETLTLKGTYPDISSSVVKKKIDNSSFEQTFLTGKFNNLGKSGDTTRQPSFPGMAAKLITAKLLPFLKGINVDFQPGSGGKFDYFFVEKKLKKKFSFVLERKLFEGREQTFYGIRFELPKKIMFKKWPVKTYLELSSQEDSWVRMAVFGRIKF
ncbi:hypothetical protein ACFL35_15815 [Candidatus Riflebacteria bacterium]